MNRKKIGIILGQQNCQHYYEEKLLKTVVVFIVWFAFIFLEVCENKEFCGILTPSVKKNISEFDQYMQPGKNPDLV